MTASEKFVNVFSPSGPLRLQKKGIVPGARIMMMEDPETGLGLVAIADPVEGGWYVSRDMDPERWWPSAEDAFDGLVRHLHRMRAQQTAGV